MRGKKDCVYGEIVDKDIKHRWGVYVYVALYFILDLNRRDMCMHSRITTRATLPRTRAGPKKEIPSKGGRRFCYRQYRDC